ncbi:hypothetical protein Tco_0815751 [Tanacetum coccineum]
MLNLCPPYIQINIIVVKVNLPQDPDLQDTLSIFSFLHTLIISQRRGINPRNPQHVTKNYETCGRNVHTTSDHNDIEWFRKRENPHAKKVESSNALRSKTPTKSIDMTTNLNPAHFLNINQAKALENSKVSFSIPTSGIYGEVGLNTFRNAIGAHYLPHSSEYVAPPSIDVVRKWFPMIGYGEEVSTKGTLKKSLLPPRAKTGPKKPTTSSKQPSVSSKEATKGGSSKAPTGSKTGYSKKRKESSSAMDSNPSRPSVSTPVDTEMHKEDQQATGGPTSLGVTSEERANPQLSSGMSALNLNKPIFSASFIIHSESASGHDVSADFTAEADPGLSAPNDSIPPQQGMDKGTKNTSYDHIFVGTDPHVLADQTKSVSEGLETVLTQPTTEKGASSTAIYSDKEEASSTIKLEDLAKLVSQIQPSFKDLDSHEDDVVIIINESDKDESNAETKDTLVPRSSSPRSSQIQELTNQELPKEFLSLPAKVESTQAKLKTLDTLLSLLLNVTKTLNKFAEVFESTSTKAGDHSVPSAGHADTMPAKGEKDINQATISQLF